MKFGKLLREQQGGWILLDYKRLKHLLKESPQTFAEELWGSIATVNAGFLEGERTLVAQLSVQTAGERDCSEFLDEVRQLYRSTVLNYIACLKIVKKHDKVRQDGVQPLRPQMLEYLFSQAFVASLEHSYLFEECWRFLHSRPLCSGCIDSGLAESISKDFDQMRRLTPSSVTELEIERMLGASPGSAERYFPKTQRPGTMTSSSPLTGARNGSLPCGTGGFRLDAEEQSCNMPISLSSPGRRSQLLLEGVIATSFSCGLQLNGRTSPALAMPNQSADVVLGPSRMAPARFRAGLDAVGGEYVDSDDLQPPMLKTPMPVCRSDSLEQCDQCMFVLES